MCHKMKEVENRCFIWLILKTRSQNKQKGGGYTNEKQGEGALLHQEVKVCTGSKIILNNGHNF